MRNSGLFAVALLGASALQGTNASARPPADDFLNAQLPGPRLTLMPFIGPGFRAIYDQRFEIEKDMSELRAQVMGTVTVPFAEVSANLDARFFLMTFGASVGYHDEWHLLRFTPDPNTGRDRGGQPPSVQPPGSALPPELDPATTFTDLDRNARAVKDQNADVQSAHWPYYEGRWGFIWPAYHFMGSSTLAARHDDRPDVSYDWENGTTYSHGWNARWETYFLFRERNTGFVGPAFRALYVPRNRVPRDEAIGKDHVVVPGGSACQSNEGIPCDRVHEFEFHYGVLAGLRPNWIRGADTLLVRAYATWGEQNRLFGTQAFRQPLQILVAYMAELDL